MKKSISMLIIGLVMLTLIGLMLFVVITATQNDFSRSFRLQENGITQEKLEIDGLDLKPGDSREYELIYLCDGGGNYDLTFDFELVTSGGMEQFVVVEVEYANRKVTVPLADLFQEENSIELTLHLTTDVEEKVYLRFAMPQDVGNEAQRTTVDFWVQMTAKHSGGAHN